MCPRFSLVMRFAAWFEPCQLYSAQSTRKIGFLITFLLASSIAQQRQETRLVVTFLTHADNMQSLADIQTNNYTIVKQYGRRLVLDLGRPFELNTERVRLEAAFNAVQNVERDYLVGLQGVDPPPPLEVHDAFLSAPDLGSLANAWNQSSTVYSAYSIDTSTQTPLWNLMESEPYSIHAVGVWPVTNSTPDVVVAVVDSGIALSAKSMFLNLLEGHDFISDDSISLDGDGRDPDATDPGDWCQTSAPGWHGTKVASLLAARHDNEWGMKGVAQNCSVLPLRVLGLCSMGYATDVTDAIVWAAGGLINGVLTNPNPAQIISLSLAGQGTCPDYIQSAVTQAISLGAVVVAAAGNNNQDVADFFPANCNGVVAVAASTRNGFRAAYSNWGLGITLSAPGGDAMNAIMTLGVDAAGARLQVTYGVGTSYAVPHVAAAAAIQLCIQPPSLQTSSDDLMFYYYTQFETKDVKCATEQLCGRGVLSLRKTNHETAFLSIDSPAEIILSNSTNDLENETLFAAADTCLQGQYTPSYADTSCIACPAGTYRSINSAPIAGQGKYGPWFPMKFTWGGNPWMFADRYYDGYGTRQQPVFYTNRNVIINGGTYGVGCANFQATSWMYTPSSISDPKTTCKVGQSGVKTGFFGTDMRLTTVLAAATEKEWCIDCTAGKFSAAASASICTLCPAASYSLGIGATACTPCDACVPGTFTSKACASVSNTVCDKCPFVPTYTASRTYPPKQFNTASNETSLELLGQTVFTQSLTLTSDAITYGHGTYTLFSSSIWKIANTKSYLFTDDQFTGRAHWATNQYNYHDATYDKSAFLVYGYKGEWIFVKLPNPIVLTGFKFYARTDWSSRAPASWKCYGSNDGLNFEEIPGGSQTMYLSTSNYDQNATVYTRTVSPEPTKAFLYIGWTIHEILDYDTMLNFGKIEIFGKEIIQELPTHYSNTAAASVCQACISCPAGQYANPACSSTSDAVCQRCSAGKYSTTLGATVASVCQLCPAGTYFTGVGLQTSANCTKCSAGQYSTTLGATIVGTCQLCSAGTYFTGVGLQTSTLCVKCGAGQYATAIGAVDTATCQLCSAGRYATGLGATALSSCLSCPAGTYFTGVGLQTSANCVKCGAGQYSTALGAVDTATCQLCSAGTYSTSSGAILSGNCPFCLAGTYQTGTGMPSSASCVPCAAGTFSGVVGAVLPNACLACPAGRYSAVVMATTLSTCLACAAGKFSSATGAPLESGTCSSCMAGTYSSALGATVASACQRCQAGSYLVGTGASLASACTPCAAGSYSTALGAVTLTACTSCSTGKYSIATGAALLSTCVPCLAGSFNNKTGATTCDQCTVCDYGRSPPRSTTFAPCLEGSVNNLVSCLCHPGYYGKDGLACTQCPANTNSTHGNTSSLLDCICLPGYTCVYKKKINLVIRIQNMTLSQFNIFPYNITFMNAVARAANVNISQVKIIAVNEGGNGLRRSFDGKHSPSRDGKHDNDMLNERSITVLMVIFDTGILDTNKVFDYFYYDHVKRRGKTMDRTVFFSLSWEHAHSLTTAQLKL